jgi:hypothetical protein
MTWSKKHFEGIAEVIKTLDAEGNSRGVVIERFVAMLKATNGKFDEERFAAACGGAR